MHQWPRAALPPGSILRGETEQRIFNVLSFVEDEGKSLQAIFIA
jgi:hypothetical protein